MPTLTVGCHCGAITFEMGEVSGHRGICHCHDCRRHFCGHCGTALFCTNDVIFPGMIAGQIATLDDPGAVAPAAEIQVAASAG